MTWVKKWLTKWLGINDQQVSLRSQQEEIKQLRYALKFANEESNDLKTLLKRHTVAGTDVRPNGGSFVVLIGRYRNNDYVECFQMPREQEFGYFVEQCRRIKRDNGRFLVDAPVSMRSYIRASL